VLVDELAGVPVDELQELVRIIRDLQLRSHLEAPAPAGQSFFASAASGTATPASRAALGRPAGVSRAARSTRYALATSSRPPRATARTPRAPLVADSVFTSSAEIVVRRPRGPPASPNGRQAERFLPAGGEQIARLPVEGLPQPLGLGGQPALQISRFQRTATPRGRRPPGRAPSRWHQGRQYIGHRRLLQIALQGFRVVVDEVPSSTEHDEFFFARKGACRVRPPRGPSPSGRGQPDQVRPKLRIRLR